MPFKSSNMGRFDHRFTVAFAFAIFGLVAIGVFQQMSIMDVKKFSNMRAEARKTAYKLKTMKAALVDAETSQRGYIITSNEAYLRPYFVAVKSIPETYKNLELGFENHSFQYRNLEKVHELMNHKLALLAKTIELKKQGHNEAVVKIVKSGEGQRYMEALREVLDVMDEEQQRLITERNASMEEVIERSARVLFFGSFLGIFLVGTLLFQLARNHKKKAEANRALEEQRNLLSKVISTQNTIATASLDTNAVMELVVTLSKDLTDSDGAIIEVVDGTDLVYHHSAGAANQFLGMRIAQDASFSGLCLKEGRTMICEDSELDNRVNREACRKVNLRSMVVVPLQHAGTTIGILKNYSAAPKHYTEERANALSLVTGILSATLGQAYEFAEKQKVITALEKTKIELEESRDKAQMATEAKSRFLANMSHEIRTPLNGIIGMTGIIMDGPLMPDQREYANALKTAGDTLLRLVNDVLDFSKVESGYMEFESVNFDLVSTLQDLTKSFTFTAKQKKIDLKLDINKQFPALVNGDPGRVRQVFMNLIGNSIKFTESGSVTIKATCTKEDARGTHLRFDITDTGIGMSQKVMSGLFQEFVQGDVSTTRKYGGTGLGLSICKRLVEKMNGKIGVESVEGKGSNFWFTLVLAPGQVLAEEKFDGSAKFDLPTRSTPWRILVGEDNQINQMIIIKVLEKMGLRADVAANGKEVVESMQNRPYDLILMDCHMPEMDGYQATAHIRASKTIPNPGLPIIAMTANAMKGDRERVLEGGMTDYISKPLDVKKVKLVLHKWLNHLLDEEKNAA